MIHIRYRILILITLLSITLQGQKPVTGEFLQKFVHLDDNHKLVLIESLDPGMTLYSLSRRYNVTIDLILAANPDLQPHAIPLGYPVNIPIDPQSLRFNSPPEETDRILLSYRVQPKETLYHISKTYLHVNPDVIINMNPEAAQGLSIGQVLQIGWLIPSLKLIAKDTLFSTDSTSLMPKDFIKEAIGGGKVIKVQKGLAIWKPGNLSAHYYVLHPTAKVGSYMEITNLMLHRTITAKVAGHIPPGLYKSNVGIVVSPSIARALGVLDAQFYAKWRYVE